MECYKYRFTLLRIVSGLGGNKGVSQTKGTTSFLWPITDRKQILTQKKSWCHRLAIILCHWSSNIILVILQRLRFCPKGKTLRHSQLLVLILEERIWILRDESPKILNWANEYPLGPTKKQNQAKQIKVALPRELREKNISLIVSGLEETLEPPRKDVIWTITNQLQDEVRCCQGRSPEERRLHLPPWSVNFKVWLGVYFSIPWFVGNNVFPWASTVLPSLSCTVSLDLNWRCPSVENPELTSQINSVLDQIFSSHFYNFLLDQKSVSHLSLLSFP